MNSGVLQFTSILAHTRATTSFVVTGFCDTSSMSGTTTFTVVTVGVGVTTSPRQPHGPASLEPPSAPTHTRLTHCMAANAPPRLMQSAVGGDWSALVSSRSEQAAKSSANPANEAATSRG